MKPHARMLSVIRVLRSFGPLKRRRKIPRQQQPDLIRKEYFTALMPFVRPALVEFHKVRGQILSLHLAERRQQGKADHMDASDKERQAKALIDRAATKAANAWKPRDLIAVAEKFGRRTSGFQQEQLDKQVRAAVGVPLSAIEKPITDKLEGFAATNVELIRSVSDRYFDRLRSDVTDAFESGMSTDSLAELLASRDDMSENDAMRIARDQIGKLNGQLNQERQEDMGVTGYTWRGAMDNRERDEHVDREGQHFEWDDPPEDGHPGEPIQCRCFAEPDLQPILDDIEEATS